MEPFAGSIYLFNHEESTSCRDQLDDFETTLIPGVDAMRDNPHLDVLSFSQTPKCLLLIVITVSVVAGQLPPCESMLRREAKLSLMLPLMVVAIVASILEIIE